MLTRRLLMNSRLLCSIRYFKRHRKYDYRMMVWYGVVWYGFGQKTSQQLMSLAVYLIGVTEPPTPLVPKNESKRLSQAYGKPPTAAVAPRQLKPRSAPAKPPLPPTTTSRAVHSVKSTVLGVQTHSKGSAPSFSSSVSTTAAVQKASTATDTTASTQKTTANGMISLLLTNNLNHSSTFNNCSQPHQTNILST